LCGTKGPKLDSLLWDTWIDKVPLIGGVTGQKERSQEESYQKGMQHRWEVKEALFKRSVALKTGVPQFVF